MLNNVNSKTHSILRKFRLTFIITLVIAVVSISMLFAVRVQYETVASNLSLNEIIPMQNALSQEGIRNRVTNNGTTLQVDRRQTQDAIIVIVALHSAPH